MVTYGFYNSINHDRRYDAVQMSSIFDGIIEDGVYMSIGGKFMVRAEGGMTVSVGTGRAWFKHTWTLNDSILPLEVPQSEVLLDRIDAVVLVVDWRPSVRANKIRIVKGRPSANPSRPVMISTDQTKYYPLAFISVKAGVTSIRTADITNMVGTSSTPFVTGVIQRMNINDLVAQWQDQWQAFYEKETADMTDTNAFWKEQWKTWFEAQTREIQEAYLSWEREWRAWYESQTTEMTDTKNYWQQLWEAWFYQYVNDNIKDIANWKIQNQQKFDEWFNALQVLVDSNVATNLANELIEVKNQIKVLEKFKYDMVTEQTIYDVLYDNTYRHYENVLDSSGNNVLDNESDTIVSGTYMSEPILDSDGHEIEARTKFAIL